MSRKLNRVLAVGIPKVDNSFQGFQSGDFVVLFGHNLCKRLLFLLSVRCQLPLRAGGLNSKAIYIDGGNTFDPYAVSAIARQYGLDPRSVLQNIFISRAFTAYQLTALVFEKLEETVKRHNSKLVVVSDIAGLFLDRDVPKIEGRDIFLKMARYLSILASKRQVIVVVSCFPRSYSSRSLFFEAALFGSASSVIELKQSKSVSKFTLEHHLSSESFVIDFLPNVVTIDGFEEA